MTPTRYPGWRFFGFLLAINNALWVAAAVSLVLAKGNTPLIAAGWVTTSTTPTSPAFLTFTFCMSLTIAGAVISTRRPALGFLIFGAGYLASAVSIGVLFHGSPTWSVACAYLGGPGALYTWLGFRQRTEERSQLVAVSRSRF